MGRRSWSYPFTYLLIIGIALAVWPSQANAEDEPEQSAIKIVIDASVMTFDSDPVPINGTTMVPARALFEAMGFAVEWHAANRQVTAIAEELVIVLRLDDEQAFVNGRALTLSQAPLLMDGVTWVPLRFIGEASRSVVHWDPAFREISILTPAMLGRLGIEREQMLELLAAYNSNQHPALPEPAVAPVDLNALQGMYAGYRADMGGYECGGLCWELYTFMPGNSVYVGLPQGGGPETIDCDRDGCSIYVIANDALTLSSGESYPVRVTEHGQLSIDSVLLNAVKPVEADLVLNGTYAHIGYNGYIGIDPDSTAWKDVITFRTDGTFERGSLAIAGSSDAQTQQQSGKYKIEGNTMTLTFEDGTAAKLLFFLHEEGSLREIQLGGDKYVIDR